MQSLSWANGALGVLSTHDGMHHLCHTAGLPVCGAVALVLAFKGFASPAMQSPSLAHGAVGVLSAHNGLHHLCHTAGL